MPDASARSATILVCDDKHAIRELVRPALADGDCTVIEAPDGERALELARECRPDVMILDLMMRGETVSKCLPNCARIGAVQG